MKKPSLSFWQIWNMSFGFFGLQFGFALQNANVSRIFETLGAKIDDIPILWIAAPFTGLIIQPIIGHMSDNTWGKLGRRRPYFLVGAILASIAILIMPNSPTLWIAAGMLWMMDGSINITMEPFRAFVGDNLPDEQRTIGFSMQSFFIGMGAVIASALPYILTNWLGISNVASENEIPQSVKYSFYFGGAVFLLSILYTIFSTKEYSPEELESFEIFKKVKSKDYLHDKKTDFLSMGFIWLLSGVFLLFISQQFFTIDYGLKLLFWSIMGFGFLQILASIMVNMKKSENAFIEILTDLYKMPKTMKQLAIVQFFSWFALFAMWIYTTPAVTHHIYGATDTKSALYNEGANWVGILMSVYNGFAAIMAFVLMFLAKKYSRKIVHSISLIAGGIGLISFYFITDPKMLMISELGIGLAWASILSMPYAILTGSLPQKKLGVYMGIFNFFIVLPQITAASILGFIVKNVFAGEAISALIIGGSSMLLASILVVRVDD